MLKENQNRDAEILRLYDLKVKIVRFVDDEITRFIRSTEDDFRNSRKRKTGRLVATIDDTKTQPGITPNGTEKEAPEIDFEIIRSGGGKERV